MKLIEKMRKLTFEGKCHLVISAGYSVTAGLALAQFGLPHSLPEIVIAAAYARLALGGRV
jgi:hypothetical protein